MIYSRELATSTESESFDIFDSHEACRFLIVVEVQDVQGVASLTLEKEGEDSVFYPVWATQFASPASLTVEVGNWGVLCQTRDTRHRLALHLTEGDTATWSCAIEGRPNE